MSRKVARIGAALAVFLALPVPAQSPPLLDVQLRSPSAALYDALGSRFARDIFRLPRVRRGLTSTPDRPFDVAGMAAGIALLLRDSLPSAVRVVAPAESGVALGALFRFDALTDCLAVMRERTEPPKKRVTELQRELLDVLKQLAALRLDARLEFTRESVAVLTWDALIGELRSPSESGEESELQLDEVEGGFDVDLDIVSWFGLDDVDVLAAWGILADEDDAMRTPMLEATKSLRFVFSLRRDESVIELSLHRRGAPPIEPLAAVDLPADRYLGIDWSLGDLATGLREAVAKLDALLTAEEIASLQSASWPLVARRALVDEIEAMPRRGTLHAALDGPVLHLDWNGEMPATSVCDASAAVLCGVPEEIAVADWSATEDLPSFFLSTLLRVDSVITSGAGDESDGAEGPSSITRSLTGSGPELDAVRAAFLPGRAVLVDDDGWLWVTKERQTRANGRIPALAVIAPVVDRDRGLSAARGLLAILGRALGGDGSDVVVDAFDMKDSPPRLSLELPALFGEPLHYGGDLRFHAFALDDTHVVLSTSARLSRRVIDAHQSGVTSPFARRALAQPVGWSLETSGRDLARLAARTCRWFDDWNSSKMRLVPSSLDRIADACFDLGRLVGPIRFHSRVEDAHCIGEGTIRFGPPEISLEAALAEVRSAIGAEWPADKLLVATGTKGRFNGFEVPFRFAMAVDGRCVMHVLGADGVSSAWDGRQWTHASAMHGGGINDEWDGPFEVIWASVLCGSWAFENFPVSRELVYADEDRLDFLLAWPHEPRRRTMLVTFDRERRVVTHEVDVAHRTVHRDETPTLRLDDYRVVEGRLLPHRIVGGTPQDRSPLEYPVDSWSLVDIGGESFRCDAPPCSRLDAESPRAVPLVVDRDDRHLRPCVELTLPGDRRVLVGIELGQTGCTFSSAWLEQVAAPSLRGEPPRRATLDGVSIGPLHLDGLIVEESKVPPKVHEREVVGRIGLAAMDSAILEFDFVRDELRFLPLDGAHDVPDAKWRRMQLGGSGRVFFEARLDPGFSDWVNLDAWTFYGFFSAFALDRLPAGARTSILRTGRLSGLDLGGELLASLRTVVAGDDNQGLSDLRAMGSLPLLELDHRVLVVDVPGRRYALR
ncbi:MAG: hypothetical protein U1F36_13675 [Planctomycetota bacterium]